MNAPRRLLFLSVLVLAALAAWMLRREGGEAATGRVGSGAHAQVEAPPETLAVEVRAANGAPLAAAELSVRLVEGGIAREIARAPLAPDGRARVELAQLAALPTLVRAGCALEVRARAAGFQPRVERLSLGARSDHRALAFLLELAPGAEIAGRVVDAAGLPVAGALVRRIVAGTSLGAPTSRVTGETECDARGEFVLAVAPADGAPKARIVARGEGFGTAEVELEAGASNTGELALRGAGSIEGGLRYPDGQPANEVELWAIPEEAGRLRNALVEVVRAAAEHEGSTGLYFARATTDETGAFAFRGLQPGVYTIRAPRPEIDFEPRQGHYQLGTKHVALGLEVNRVVVRVRDGEGRPLSGARVSCTELREAEGSGLEPSRTLHQSTRAPLGTASFEVEAETPLVLSAQVPGGLATEETVILSPGEFEVTRDLVVVPSDEVGRVRVRIRAGTEALGSYTVALLAETTQVPLAGAEALRPDAQGWLPPVPAGRFRPAITFDEDAAGAERYAFPIAAGEPVLLERGGELELAFEAHLGGRIEIALDVAGPPPEDFGLRPAQEGEPAETVREQRRRRGAALRLVAPGGSAQTVEFLVPSVEADAQLVERTSLLLPGERAPAVQLFAPGRYTLEVDALGFRHLSLPVTIEAGRTLEIAVPMRAL